MAAPLVSHVAIVASQAEPPPRMDKSDGCATPQLGRTAVSTRATLPIFAPLHVAPAAMAYGVGPTV